MIAEPKKEWGEKPINPCCKGLKKDLAVDKRPKKIWSDRKWTEEL